jgi:polar amino acid transport system substrate-binding protein
MIKRCSGWPVSLRAVVCLLWAVLWLVPCAVLGASECDHLTATGNAEYPPYLWRDPQDPQRLIGANADLVKKLGEQLGLQIDVVYVGPWSRSQEEVRAGRIDMLAGYFLTDARQQVVDFITPPFLATSSMVWVRRDAAFPYHQWSDLIGRSGGTLVNNSNGQAFDEFARAHLSLEAVPTASQAFQKLMLKRNDYFIFEQYPGFALARTLGIYDQVQALEPPVSSDGLYLALSRSSKCITPSLRDRMAAQMQAIVSSPLPQALVKANLELWNSQQKQTEKP